MVRSIDGDTRCDLVELVLTRSGESEYFFKSSSMKPNSDVLLQLNNLGWGIAVQSGAFDRDRIIDSTSCVVLPIGHGKQRLCVKCYSVSKIIKVRADCPSLSFCSMECLENSRAFLDHCATMINAIQSWISDENLRQYSDTALLLMTFLYRTGESENDSRIYQVRQLARLERHALTIMPEIKLVASRFLSQLKQFAPSLLNKHCSDEGQIANLLRAVQFNAQPLPVPGLPPGTALLTILPESLARVNHSCRPNAVLRYSIKRKEEKKYENNKVDGMKGDGNVEQNTNKVDVRYEVVTSLIAVKNILPGDEVYISYLSQLCIPVETRREMLRSSFYFKCECVRCVEESHTKNIVDNKIEMTPANANVNGCSGEERKKLKECDTNVATINVANSRTDPSSSLNPSSTMTSLPSPSYSSSFLRHCNDTDTDVTHSFGGPLLTALDKVLNILSGGDSGTFHSNDSRISFENENRSLRRKDGTDPGSSLESSSNSISFEDMRQLLSLSEEYYDVIREQNIDVRASAVRTISPLLYSVHDSAMVVLKGALKYKKDGLSDPKIFTGINAKVTGLADIGRDAVSDDLIFRTSIVVCGCWILLGCEMSTVRLETLLTGVAAGLRIRSRGQVEKCKALSGIATDALSLLSLFYCGIDRSLGDLFTDVERGRVGNPAINGVVNAKSSTPNSGIVEKECFLAYSNSNGKYIEQAVAMCRSAISDTSSLPLSASIHLKQ